MAGSKTMRQTLAGFALVAATILGAAAIAAPAGAATTAHAGCSYYTPDECGGGGDGGGGGDYPTIPDPSTPTPTPMIDPGLIGLAAASIGGGAGGLVLRKRARRA